MNSRPVVAREKVVAGQRRGLGSWPKLAFVFMHGTMLSATEYFRIPTNRAVELGGQTEI
jgi:KUP system potassium uptake protein